MRAWFPSPSSSYSNPLSLTTRRRRQACDLCQALVSGLGRDVNYRARSAQPRGCKFTESSRINHVTWAFQLHTTESQRPIVLYILDEGAYKCWPQSVVGKIRRRKRRRCLYATSNHRPKWKMRFESSKCSQPMWQLTFLFHLSLSFSLLLSPYLAWWWWRCISPSSQSLVECARFADPMLFR